MWQGLGLLFALSFVVLVLVTLLTPPESEETLKRFYARCRPAGFWGPISRQVQLPDSGEPSPASMFIDSGLGIFASLCLVLATNAIFVGDWLRFGLTIVGGSGAGAWLLHRMWKASKPSKSVPSINPEVIAK
jgi:hypothetical protein